MTVPIKGGRPKAFKSVEEMQEKINAYFEYCDNLNVDDKGNRKIIKPYTMQGLCVYLDIARDTWNQYSKKSEFSDACKKARQKVEAATVEGASTNKLNPVFTIFNLKNNFGWTDKVEVTTKEDDKLSSNDIKNKLKELKKNE
ncbi:MAG: DNA-packaging protein [Candidatus Odinarchaeota archaeon]